MGTRLARHPYASVLWLEIDRKIETGLSMIIPKEHGSRFLTHSQMRNMRTHFDTFSQKSVPKFSIHPNMSCLSKVFDHLRHHRFLFREPRDSIAWQPCCWPCWPWQPWWPWLLIGNGGVFLAWMAYKNWGHFVASGDIVRWSMTVYDRVSHSLFKWAYNIL